MVEIRQRTVLLILVAAQAPSTIAYGVGPDVDTGEFVVFAGDLRPMAEAYQAAMDQGSFTEVDVDPWQVVAVAPPLIEEGATS